MTAKYALMTSEDFDDISGLLHTPAKYALMTSADSDDISGILHTSAKYARPLITTPLSAN